MCGLTGFFQPGQQRLSPDNARDALARMSASLHHRGPDDHGQWFDVDAGIALAHRRLSILDLSPLGHQPMVSADGRYQIVYNGEIYNHAVLRDELLKLGHSFAGHSDTEVLLAAIQSWGLPAALQRSNGMFALALWDRQQRQLHLARDRVGKKPLYYGWCGESLLFASELKAMMAFPGFDPAVDRGALALFLRHDYIPSPWSIYQGVFKLMPGHTLTLDAAAVLSGAEKHDPNTAATPFWNALEVARAAHTKSFQGSDQDALDTLDARLRDAVAQRMVADVPVGVFLSGGTDSSLVTALMQAQSPRPVKTFTIGFSDSSHDEAAYAKAVAHTLGSDHTELYLDGSDALAVVPDLPAMFDEPFADSSQIPMYLVSRLARRHVTVALSGDGGDELFGGYTRYPRALANWRRRQRIPAPLRTVLRTVLGQHGDGEARDSRLAMLATELAADSPEAVYLNRVSRWRQPGSAIANAIEHSSAYTDRSRWLSDATPLERFMFMDFQSYLPDDVMAKVDRASMAVSLEARAPLLDVGVIELAWSLPTQMKLRGGESKWLLKSLLARYLPEKQVYRPKYGFGAPVGDWLRGPLREWAEDLLSAERLAREGYFDVAQIRTLWEAFLAGQRKWHTHLWNVLMFQAWNQWRQHPSETRRPPVRTALAVPGFISLDGRGKKPGEAPSARAE